MIIKSISATFLVVIFCNLIPSWLFAAKTGIPQASLTLKACAGENCYTHDNKWTLLKNGISSVANGDGTFKATWQIVVDKDATQAPTYSVHGGLSIQNTGSGNATIGNIVINLQKPNKPKKASNSPYVSIGADIADATLGGSASMANIVAAASEENAATNAAWSINNYTVSGSVGKFIETSCSGLLEFKDANNNTIFSLSPQKVLAPNETVNLLYDARFNVACLPPAGTVLRVEALVTFGNAGERGGSGATATNVDFNGSNTVSSDGNNVRTVPCRATLPAFPSAPIEANSTVTVTDNGLSATNTVTFNNVTGLENFPISISDDASWMITADVDGGANGGLVCNSAQLDGFQISDTLDFIIAYGPLGNPIYASYVCAEATHAEGSYCFEVASNGGRGRGGSAEFVNGEYCSFSQGGYGGRGNPYQILSTNFAAVYPSYLEVGVAGLSGYSMQFTSATKVQDYLPQGSTASALTSDLINPTSSSSGVFGGQVTTLKLNIDYNDLGLLPYASTPKYGDLYYCDGSSSLNGKKVREILDIAQSAIGQNIVPAGYSFGSLNQLVEKIAVSFDLKSDTLPTCGIPSEFAQLHLRKNPCQ